VGYAEVEPDEGVVRVGAAGAVEQREGAGIVAARGLGDRKRVQRTGVMGIESERLFERRQGLLAAPEAEERIAERRQGGDVVRVPLQMPAIQLGYGRGKRADIGDGQGKIIGGGIKGMTLPR
jgi:hypothetical protein